MLRTYLQAARITAALTGEWTANVDHFMAEIIQNVHLKLANIPAPVARATAAIFCRIKYFLTNGILDHIFVVCFISTNHYLMGNSKVIISENKQ